MNKVKLSFLLILQLTAVSVFSQEKLKTATRPAVGFYHIGSYSKERPILLLEQDLDYVINPSFKLGIHAGFNLYPAAAALPLGLHARYVMQAKKTSCIITQGYSRHLKLTPVFFSANRYYGTLGICFNKQKRLQIIPELGYLYLWEQYGGKAISFTAGIRLTY